MSNRFVHFFKSGLKILFLLLLATSSQIQAKLFTNLTQSKHYSDVYYDLDSKLKTYLLTDEGWKLKGETQVIESNPPSSWVPIIETDAQQLFVAITHDTVVNYQLNENGVPIEATRRIVWERGPDSPAQWGYISKNGSQLMVTEAHTGIVTLYHWINDQYEQVDFRDYGDAVTFDRVYTSHFDGSLIGQSRNIVVPVAEGKLSDLTNHPTHIEYAFSEKSSGFLSDSSFIFLDSQYDGDYVVKLNWPVTNSEFNYQVIYQGSVDEFEISPDGRWMVYRDFNHYGIVEFDASFNIINEYILDSDWLTNNLKSQHEWEVNHDLSSPIFRNSFLWISNLRIDLSSGVPVAFEQNTQNLKTLNLKSAEFIGYGDKVIADLGADNGKLIFELNNEGDAITRANFEQSLDPELVTGKTDYRLLSYRNIPLENKVFAEGNPNKFELQFQFENPYREHVDSYFPFDANGFISTEKFVISDVRFQNGFKVLNYSAMASNSLNSTFELKTLNQNQTLELDVSQYFELSADATISLGVMSRSSGNSANYDTFDKIGSVSGSIVSIFIDKQMALDRNLNSPFYILVEEANWRASAQVPAQIVNVNEAPVAAAVEQQNLLINDNYVGHLDEVFTDADLDPLVYTVSGLPPGLVFQNLSITGSPTTTGRFEVSVTATDTGGLSASVSFVINVSDKSQNSESSSSGGTINYCLIIFITGLVLWRRRSILIYN